MVRLVPIVLLIASSVLAGQDAVEEGCYRGKLGENAITMVVENGRPEYAGGYRYVKQGGLIGIVREKMAGDLVVFSELGNGHGDATVTGRFSGKIDAENHFAGTWASADRKRTYPFELYQIARMMTYRIELAGRYVVSFKVPQLVGKAAFYAAVNEDLQRMAQEKGNSATREFAELTAGPEPGPLPQYSEDMVEVVHVDEGLVSLLVHHAEYTGGAHANYTYEATVYEWREGKAVRLKAGDILPAGVQKQVMSLVVKDLERQKAGWANQVGSTSWDDLVINPTGEGVLFTFAPYTADCFAVGIYTVLIPYQSIPLPAGSPLLHLGR